MSLYPARAKTWLLCAALGLMLSTAPAQPAEPAAETAAEEAAPTLPGTVVQRKNGTFLSVTIENTAFKVTFYDAKKKPMDPDVARAAARWDPKNKIGREHRVLNLSDDGKSLVSPVIRPPYNFKLFLVLLSEEGEAVENFVIDFRE